MISLFIDTSLSDVSIALVKEGKLLSNIKNTSPKEHSIYTTKFIEDILKENNHRTILNELQNWRDQINAEGNADFYGRTV